MKRKSLKVLGLSGLLTLCLGMAGCYQTRTQEALIQYTTLKEEAPLVDTPSSPTLSIAMHYSWLNEKVDSCAPRVNSLLQQELLGKEFAGLSPTLATDSFKNTRIRAYRQDIAPIYLKDHPDPSVQSYNFAWYNHTFELASHLQLGLHDILLCQADISEDQGGAHPDSWSRWFNIDRKTGKLITREEIFPKAQRSQVEQALLQALIHQQAGQNPDEEINTLEDLQQIGFLQNTAIYIPENFLLENEHVSFLFNRYDIGPYSAGAIVLQLSYEEIGPYMNLNNYETWN